MLANIWITEMKLQCRIVLNREGRETDCAMSKLSSEVTIMNPCALQISLLVRS